MLYDSAVAQGSPESLVATEANLLADGFGPQPRFYCVVAEVDGSPAGIALYYFDYSTWVSRRILYLEDLYIDPAFRRVGVARALLNRMVTIARNEGCGRMAWVVHRENEAALQLYRSFGAQSLDDWTLMARTVLSKDEVQ